MSDPVAALQAVRSSTADLVKGLGEQEWSDEDVRAASLCEGWSRGHVLTHLARNADSFTATLSGALRGEEVPRYPGGDTQRDADIEAGSSRSVAELLADVAETAERLDRVLGAVHEADAWDVPTYRGVPAGERLSQRLYEVEVHRVDLAGDYGPDRWPPFLVAEQLPALAENVPDGFRIVVGEEDLVVATHAGRSWGRGERIVTGPDWALVAWLAGRGRLVQHLLGDLPDVAPWR